MRYLLAFLCALLFVAFIALAATHHLRPACACLVTGFLLGAGVCETPGKDLTNNN